MLEELLRFCQHWPGCAPPGRYCVFAFQRNCWLL